MTMNKWIWFLPYAAHYGYSPSDPGSDSFGSFLVSLGEILTANYNPSLSEYLHADSSYPKNTNSSPAMYCVI
jgi:hypothetical protein